MGKTKTAKHGKYGKYFRDIERLKKLDVYRIFDLYGPLDHALEHAVKKLLLGGDRTGGKGQVVDVLEARDSLNRWLEMQAEDGIITPGYEHLAVDWDKAEARMDNIGPNGNEGEHYKFEELAKLIDHAPSWADHLYQPISSRSVYARNAEGRDHLLSQTVAASDEELTMPLPPVHWLICTDNHNQEELLSEGKKYSTRSNPSANLITVTDDNGQIGQFRGNRFKPFTETQKPLEQVEVVTP